MTIPILEGLPGTTSDKEFDFFRSPDGALKILRAGRAAVASETNGAINVWKDDDGNYRAVLLRLNETLGEATVGSLKSMREQLKAWLPQIK